MLKSTPMAIAALETLLCNLSISNGMVPANCKNIPDHKVTNPIQGAMVLLPIISEVHERYIYI